MRTNREEIKKTVCKKGKLERKRYENRREKKGRNRC